MTKNLAGRGEGLAGAIACVKEFIAWATEQIGTSEARGCAEQAEDALKLLEAAAPPSTAPRHELRTEILRVNKFFDRYAITKAEGWSALVEMAEKELRDEIALATPSPQAPAGDRTFSPTEQTPSSMATASARNLVAGFGSGDYSCAVCGMGMKEPCEHWKASAASHGETEEDAGRQPEVCQSSSVEMTVKRWFCERCGVEHSIEIPNCVEAVVSSPAATQEQPAGSAMGRLGELLAANGVEIKFGLAAQGHIPTVEKMLSLAREIAADLEDAGLVEPGLCGIEAMEIIARRLRSSSVPVGEQKQEEGV